MIYYIISFFYLFTYKMLDCFVILKCTDYFCLHIIYSILSFARNCKANLLSFISKDYHQYDIVMIKIAFLFTASVQDTARQKNCKVGVGRSS